MYQDGPAPVKHNCALVYAILRRDIAGYREMG